MPMIEPMLLCSDLDRTLLPNGPQPESEQARPLLRTVAAHSPLTLVYVSGRHRQLLLDAIAEYDLPVPQFAIGDVGTTIYEITDGDWHPWSAWEQEIAPDWHGMTREQLTELFADIDALRLQEPEKQNTFKLSYYAPANADGHSLRAALRDRLAKKGIRASLIWSIDEMAHVGLLDVLPERATKLHAIRFLMEQKGFSEERTVFAGDSGNDLPVLTSGLQAILVRNAADSVRWEALQALEAAGRKDRLYLARGGFLDMNGNYSAGVLEGLAHFLPETEVWMRESDIE